jgi:hypothetical protein
MKKVTASNAVRKDTGLMTLTVKVILKDIGSEGLQPQLIRCAPFLSIAPYFRILYLSYPKIRMAIIAYPKVRTTIIWYPDVETSIVTRTSASSVAPIHFPSRSRLLSIPGRLRAHTHAIPILADRTLPLPLLVIFPLITFSLSCTIFARRTPGSRPLCPFHLTGTHPIIP